MPGQNHRLRSTECRTAFVSRLSHWLRVATLACPQLHTGVTVDTSLSGPALPASFQLSLATSQEPKVPASGDALRQWGTRLGGHMLQLAVLAGQAVGLFCTPSQRNPVRPHFLSTEPAHLHPLYWLFSSPGVTSKFSLCALGPSHQQLPPKSFTRVHLGGNPRWDMKAIEGGPSRTGTCPNPSPPRLQYLAVNVTAADDRGPRLAPGTLAWDEVATRAPQWESKYSSNIVKKKVPPTPGSYHYTTFKDNPFPLLKKRDTDISILLLFCLEDVSIPFLPLPSSGHWLHGEHPHQPWFQVCEAGCLLRDTKALRSCSPHQWMVLTSSQAERKEYSIRELAHMVTFNWKVLPK